MLALFPAVGFGYGRYERVYALDANPNPLLRCFVWRSVRRFNWWFVGLGTLPITAWVVGKVLSAQRVEMPAPPDVPTTEPGSEMVDAAAGAIVWMFDIVAEVGDAVAWLLWFVALVIPVACVLTLILIVIPSIVLSRTRRKWRIGSDNFGNPAFLS